MAENKNQFGNLSNDDLQRLIKAMMETGAIKNPAKDAKNNAVGMAKTVWECYNAFIKVGFSNFEAFDLTKIVLEKVLE